MPVKFGVRTCERLQNDLCKTGCKRVADKCYPTDKTLEINAVNTEKQSQATVARYLSVMTGVLALLGSLFSAFVNKIFPLEKGSSVLWAHGVAAVFYFATVLCLMLVLQASKRASDVRNFLIQSALTLWFVMGVFIVTLYIHRQIYLACAILSWTLFIIAVLALFSKHNPNLVPHEEEETSS